MKLIGLFVLLMAQAGAWSKSSAHAPVHNSKPLLSVGEWVSFIGYDLTFYDNGVVAYKRGKPGDSYSRIGGDELTRLKSWLGSPEFGAAAAELRAGGYEPGCCDLHDVAFEINGEILGYPVCENRLVAEPVRGLVELLNELGSRHFRHFKTNPLPFTTCGERPAGDL